MSRRKLIARQHLGTYQVQGRQIAVYVNAEMLAQLLGPKASGSRTLRARTNFGAVLIHDVTKQ